MRENGLLLAVDGGGTKTLALVTDLEGKVLARGTGPSSNIHNVGIDESCRAMVTAIERALAEIPGRQSGTGPAWRSIRIAAACFGLAGVDAPGDEAEVERWVRRETIAERVLVVNDVRKDDMAQVAAAYRELFLAARGGALGLFTAISRLRAVHERIAGPLEDAGLPLLAQHVDGLDPSTLIDIFRAERDSCLLGTDAVRDGVDVPGESLRLIVFDRVPWARPDILHRARRDAFGGRAYDDMIARLRLKQAFGRLIRRADDRGVFVMLDPMLPSRLLGAIPEGVEFDR